MKTINNNRPVIVGIFIFLGLAILVITLFTLGGQKKTFVKSFVINAVFDDVGGLLKGGNIWFSGVKVGTVKNISFYGNASVLVTMSIENSAQPHIHNDAKARIGSDGLIGNKIIIIYGGDSASPQIAKDDYLKVEKALTTDDMLVTLQNNNKNLLDITNSFKSISKKIDSGQGTLAILLNDPAIANTLKNTVEELQTTAGNFKTVSVNGKNVLFDLQSFSNKLNKPGNSLNDIVEDTLVYKNLQVTMLQLQQASNTVKHFTENIKQVSEKLLQNNNTAGLLLNDSASANSIKVILRNLESGTLKLDQDLEALQHNFLLKGYFKKKNKAE
ncbi:MlaD family protein [Limnovirga soli]|uniref:MCE family protein n=1 Tax=Limnovirga soli TaxID=2656915 RepID=A0A8J8FES2_9BACT|nr:MlaD family protein [Limnovirga soli]NNV54616.1 MCE family protein [Limnovirga soli]